MKAVVCFLALAMAARAEEIRLKDGSVLQGMRVGVEDSVLVFRTLTLGEVRVPLSALASAPEPSGESAASQEVGADAGRNPRISGAAAAWLDPAGQALFFLPTAFTPPKNSFVFRDFELLFLTAGFSPTASTSLTAGAMFPITGEFNALTLGVKQKLWSEPKGGLALAVTGSATKPVGDAFEDESPWIFNSNLVFSARVPTPRFRDAAGFHAALGYAGVLTESESYDRNTGGIVSNVEWYDNLSFGGGMEFRLTPNAKFLAEYLSTFPLEDLADDESLGVLTFGFRLHGSRLAADIAGFRPMGDSDSDLFLLPLLVVSYKI